LTQNLERSEPESLDLPPTPAAANLLRLAWRRKGLVALGTAIGLVFGSLHYAQRTAVYSSTAQILVVKKRQDALLPGSDASMAYYDDYLATHQTLIKSPVIIGRAVKKRDLQSLRSFAEQGDPTGAIIGALSVSRDAKDSGGNFNNILNLSFRGPVAEECATVLNAVIDSYKEFLDETYRNVSDDTLELITRAKDVLQKDLAEKERIYLEFRKKSPLLWKGKDGTNLYQDRLASIELKRSGLLVRRAEIQGRLQTIESALKEGRSRVALGALLSGEAGKPAVSAASASPASTLEERLSPLLLRQQMLLEEYGPDHPQVRAIRKEIQLTRDAVTRRSATASKAAETLAPSTSASPPRGDQEARGDDSLEWHIQSLKQELDDNKQEEQVLAELFKRQYDEVRELRSYEIQEEAYRSDITRTQQLYDGIIKRLGEFNIVRDFGGYDARTISPPGSGVKVEPKPLAIFTMAACLGIVCGFGLAYGVDISDRSFRTPVEIRRQLGLPVVGHIPFFASDEAARDSAGFEGAALDPVLITYYRPQSKEAEAYRGVRTALYFGTRGANLRVIQITSPNRGDGKTTLSANLSVSIAQSGKRVLLIDADFRRPRLHKLFALPAATGLAPVLAGTAVLNDAIQESVVAGLSILPCGPRPPDPAELLSSPRLQEILESARERYDFVLVDTPPLLAVTDPGVVAPRVDGVLLNIRVSKNSRPDAERAKEVLSTLGATMIGVVVNAVSPDGAGYGAPRYHYSYQNEYSDTSMHRIDGDAFGPSPSTAAVSSSEPAILRSPRDIENGPSAASPDNDEVVNFDSDSQNVPIAVSSSNDDVVSYETDSEDDRR
jgi:succinoglycan biosynthesis transport protein ExoP